MVLSAIVSFGSALLFTKVTSIPRRRVYSGRPKLDTKVTNDSGPVNPLKLLKPQMSPASVPGENDDARE